MNKVTDNYFIKSNATNNRFVEFVHENESKQMK